jgi:hypothetical protein
LRFSKNSKHIFSVQLIAYFYRKFYLLAIWWAFDLFALTGFFFWAIGFLLISLGRLFWAIE